VCHPSPPPRPHSSYGSMHFLSDSASPIRRPLGKLRPAGPRPAGPRPRWARPPCVARLAARGFRPVPAGSPCLLPWRSRGERGPRHETAQKRRARQQPGTAHRGPGARPAPPGNAGGAHAAGAGRPAGKAAQMDGHPGSPGSRTEIPPTGPASPSPPAIAALFMCSSMERMFGFSSSTR